MPIAIRRGVPFPYVLERERGNGAHTTFYLRPLSLEEEAEVSEVPEGPGAQRKFMDKICRLGLTTWEDWYYADGTPVQKSSDVDPVELLDVRDRGELAIAIIGTERATVEKSGS